MHDYLQSCVILRFEIMYRRATNTLPPTQERPRLQMAIRKTRRDEIARTTTVRGRKNRFFLKTRDTTFITARGQQIFASCASAAFVAPPARL
jgi:hypothetical protein